MLVLFLRHVRSLVREGRLSWCPPRLKLFPLDKKSPISSSTTTGFSNYYVPPTSDPLALLSSHWFYIAEYCWITKLLYYWIKKVLFSRIILQANAGCIWNRFYCKIDFNVFLLWGLTMVGAQHLKPVVVQKNR